MKRRTVLAVVLAAVLILLLTSTALAITRVSVSLNGRAFVGTFTFNSGGCLVTTTEKQVEHRLQIRNNSFHLFSTNLGTVKAEAQQSPGCVVTLPPPSSVSLDLATVAGPDGLQFAAIDFFNPVDDKYVIKSFGLAAIPGTSLVPLFNNPQQLGQLGVDAWRVSTTSTGVTLCGYAYVYGGDYPPPPPQSDPRQLVIPFRATVSESGHSIVPGNCIPGLTAP